MQIRYEKIIDLQIQMTARLKKVYIVHQYKSGAYVEGLCRLTGKDVTRFIRHDYSVLEFQHMSGLWVALDAGVCANHYNEPVRITAASFRGKKS